MAIVNIFSQEGAQEIISRIEKLTPTSQALWGKMNVAQMLAHNCVTYEMTYEDKHPKPNFLVKFLLKSFVKKGIVKEMPYKKNSQTAPAFLIKGERNFEVEKNRLINFIKKTADLGAQHFDNKESHSFGKLSKTEWNNMFAKHLDHHLGQFGV